MPVEDEGLMMEDTTFGGKTNKANITNNANQLRL